MSKFTALDSSYSICNARLSARRHPARDGRILRFVLRAAICGSEFVKSTIRIREREETRLCNIRQIHSLLDGESPGSKMLKNAQKKPLLIAFNLAELELKKRNSPS
jgi:hypothetical protein